MGASKKQRGKQRKAAKSKAAERGGIDINTSAQVSPTKLVALIQKGNDAATSMYLSGTYNLSRIHTDLVLSSVFGSLQRCEHETFDNVLADLGGDLRSPLLWVDSIIRVIRFDSSFFLQIAQSIGPLVSCMCDDINRFFFRSNQYWKESFQSFVQLIWHILYEMIGTEVQDGSAEKDTIKTLLQHENSSSPRELAFVNCTMVQLLETIKSP